MPFCQSQPEFLKFMVKHVRTNWRYSTEYSSEKGATPKIKNAERFRDFVAKNQNKTQGKMAEIWGDNVTQQNVSYACQKLGITRKKKSWLSRNK